MEVYLYFNLKRNFVQALRKYRILFLLLKCILLVQNQVETLLLEAMVSSITNVKLN